MSKTEEYKNKLTELLATIPERPLELFWSFEYGEHVVWGAGKEQPSFSILHFVDNIAQMYFEYYQHNIEEAWEIVEQFMEREGNQRRFLELDDNFFNEYCDQMDDSLEEYRRQVLNKVSPEEIAANRIKKFYPILSKIEAYNRIFTPAISAFDPSVTERYQGYFVATNLFLNHTPSMLTPVKFAAESSDIPENTPESHWWWFAEIGSSALAQPKLHKGLSEWAEIMLQQIFGSKETRTIEYVQSLIGESKNHGEVHKEILTSDALYYGAMAGDLIVVEAVLRKLAANDIDGIASNLIREDYQYGSGLEMEHTHSAMATARAMGNMEMLSLLESYKERYKLTVLSKKEEYQHKLLSFLLYIPANSKEKYKLYNLEKYRSGEYPASFDMDRFMDGLETMYHEYFHNHIADAREVIDEFVQEGNNRQTLEEFDDNFFFRYCNEYAANFKYLSDEIENKFIWQKFYPALSKMEISNEMFADFIFSRQVGEDRITRCGTRQQDYFFKNCLLPRVDDQTYGPHKSKDDDAVDHVSKSHWWWMVEEGKLVFEQPQLRKGLAKWAENILHRTFGAKELRTEEYLQKFLAENELGVLRYDSAKDNFEMDGTLFSPVLYAVMAGDATLVKVLIEQLAVPGYFNNHSTLSAVVLAKEFGHKEIATLLEEFKNKCKAEH